LWCSSQILLGRGGNSARMKQASMRLKAARERMIQREYTPTATSRLSESATHFTVCADSVRCVLHVALQYSETSSHMNPTATVPVYHFRTRSLNANQTKVTKLRGASLAVDRASSRRQLLELLPDARHLSLRILSFVWKSVARTETAVAVACYIVTVGPLCLG
jgi:hypothetical protein